jgi:hypothetical protein
MIRKHGIGRTQKFRPATIAFINHEPWPDGTAAFEKWWHLHSLRTGHRHAAWGYSVRDACAAYGIDPDELLARLAAANRARWAAEGPIVFDKHGRLISKH